ncbi:hypothetical protein ACIQ9J_01475 [Streptomyces sp. NPDC094153]|uniref:hypothetical protein n=1 Tax=Streptomyces sp. NPDC094153 TaxID=3366058 RepID=UPI00380B2C4E
MAISVTVPVSGIEEVACYGGAILTPTSVRIRYRRRQPPDVRVSGPTRFRHSTHSDPTSVAWCFSGCTCHPWLTDLVECHRPKGFHGWPHCEVDVWRTLVGRWINTDDAPDPHRDYFGAVRAAIAALDAPHCVVLESALRNALPAA